MTGALCLDSAATIIFYNNTYMITLLYSTPNVLGSKVEVTYHFAASNNCFKHRVSYSRVNCER